MTQAFLVVGGLFLIVYVPLAILAWRRPLLARFALRESTRRRGQFALLVLGLMAASASITASLVGADTGSQTLSVLATQKLGAVDLTVTPTGGPWFPVDVANRLAADPTLSRYVDGLQAGVELPSSVADLDQRLGRSEVLVVGFDPASQRRFGAFVLSNGQRTYGQDLASGDVLLSRALVTALDARVGDRLKVSTGAGSAELRVFGIAKSTGPGAYGRNLAIYMPLATAQLVTGDSGINVVRVAARGGSAADDRAALSAAAPLRSAIARIPTGMPLAVNEVRSEVTRQASAGTGFILGATLGFSGLTVLAAIAMIVNLMLALAEERRSRLAVLRALGLTRAGLIALSVLEGAIYSVAAAVAGVAAGVPTGIYFANQLWTAALLDPTDVGFLGYPLQLTVRPSTLALAFAAGALITLATVAAAAYRTSRLAISEAIRDLPEPAARTGPGWPRIALLGIVAAAGAALLVPNDGRTRLLGGVLLIAAVAGLARGRLSDRARATMFGLLVSALAGITVAAYHLTSDLSLLLTMVLLGVAIPAVGLSIAGAANLRLVDGGLGLLGNRFGLLQATLRPPLAYLSRRPVRTGLAASAFALVLALVTLIAVVVGTGSTDRVDYARQSAGFDVLVVTSSSDPIRLPAGVEPEVASQLAIQKRTYYGPLNGTGFVGNSTLTDVTFFVLPDQLPGSGPIYLNALEKRFHSSSDVWQALRTDPSLVIGPPYSSVSPGDQLTVQGQNGPIHLHVAAVPGATVLPGIIAAPAALARIDTRPAGSALLLKARPGSDARTLARQVERSLFAQGVHAISIHDLIFQGAASNLAYTTEYDVFLHMGLLVGVLALAMIGIRAAVERRRVIGILRALGYQPPRLLAGLVAEATLTATMGVLAGIGAGLVVGYVLMNSVAPDAAFGVSLPRLAVALAIVYGTVVVVTGPLASRAARMPPSEAVRITG